MNRVDSRSHATSSRPPIRWWPAAVIVTSMVSLLAYFWLKPASQTQTRVIATFPILFFGVVFLFLWLVLFSRLAPKRRLAIFLATLVVVGLGFAMFEIVGVDGNLVPILGFRWAGERSYEPESLTGGGTAEGATDYAQFYGPRRDAMLAGPRLATDWTSRPPQEIWRREVGEGWSAFAIAGEAAVTQEQRGDQEMVVRYDLETGEEVWSHADTAPFNTTIGGKGPRATPTIDGGRVYSLGATGLLTCLELERGTLIWSRNVLEDSGTRQPDWGLPSSPLVVGELVVVAVGRGGPSLAAYHRATGEPAWTIDADSASYSTPRLASIGGREQIVIVNQGSITGHEPATGEVLWRHAWPGHGERVTPALEVDEGLLLVSAGYGQGSLMIRVAPESPNGTRFATEQLWSSHRLKSKFASMVVHEGVVYGLDDGIMVALDPETGERHWKAGRYGHGQMLLVADLLLVMTEKGDVALIEPTPEELHEVARIDALSGKTWNPPALAGELLLVRNNREAAAFRLPVARPETG